MMRAPESLRLRSLTALAGMGAIAVAAAGRQGLFSQLATIEIVLVIAFLVISLGLHEAAHAWVAWKRGDSTARDLGRMTVNPIAHIDPFMTIVLPVFLMMTTGFIFGGAKPVPVNPSRLRNPLRDMMLVAIAGPATNFLLALAFLGIWKGLVRSGAYEQGQTLPKVLYFTVLLNLLLALFNMLPIPPLDGSRVMAWILPAELRRGYVSLERFGLLLVFGFLFVANSSMAIKGYLLNSLGVMYRVADFLTLG